MQFVAFERAKQGTGASRRLRNTGRTPGIVFGGETPAATIELDHNALWHALKKEAFHSSILEMDVAGSVQKVLLRDVQYHPYKPLVLHVDFQRVNDKTRLHKKVLKTDKCVINHVMTEIEIECLATQLPEHITVDLGEVVKGGTVHTGDIKLPKGIKLVMHGRKNLTIATVVEPVEEVVAAPVVAAADDKKGAKGKKK